MDTKEPRKLLDRLGRWVTRPISRAMRWRIENLVRTELAKDVDPRLAATESTRDDLEAVQRYVPLLLNTISSQNAAARDHERRLRRIEALLDEQSEEEPRSEETQPDEPSR
ncbi:MAG TPA: hypothetical protein VMR97_02830 [Acidimicrobiales bacterium]|nr:hypothetical protein [Acidimicrobiales bacterium]